LLLVAPETGALPARSVSAVPTLITLVVSSMSSVGVKVPVQVTPPSALLIPVRAPFSTVISALEKPVTASEKVTVRIDVSPTFRALSDITTLVITGTEASIV
jgi:hypothetical protein